MASWTWIEIMDNPLVTSKALLSLFVWWTSLFKLANSFRVVTRFTHVSMFRCLLQRVHVNDHRRRRNKVQKEKNVYWPTVLLTEHQEGKKNRERYFKLPCLIAISQGWWDYSLGGNNNLLASNDTLYAYMRRLVMKEEKSTYICFLCSEGVDFPLDTVQPQEKMGGIGSHHHLQLVWY